MRWGCVVGQYALCRPTMPVASRLPCAARETGASRKLACGSNMRLADPRFAVLLGGLDVRPSAHRPPPWTSRGCILHPEARYAVRVGRSLVRRRAAQLFADQGRALSERSEFARTPRKASSAGKPEGPSAVGSTGPYRVPGGLSSEQAYNNISGTIGAISEL